MPSSPLRYRGGRTSVDSFLDETLVVCPRCGGCARIGFADSSRHDSFAPRKLTCPSCGHSRRWEEHSMTRHFGQPAVDDFFGLPLWIQAPCCGHTLWAYNWRHLRHIEDFVRAVHRERRRDRYGWSNFSLTTALPRWMKAAHNRVPLLDCIEKLRQARSMGAVFA